MDVEDYYVSKYYEMNPETDVLLPSGHDLRNGMIVLIANQVLRAEPPVIVEHDEYWRPRVLDKYTKFMGPEGARRKYKGSCCEGPEMEAVREALRWNRWCTVSHLEIRKYHHMKDYVVFVGTYEDRSQFKLFADISQPWLRRKGNDVQESQA